MKLTMSTTSSLVLAVMALRTAFANAATTGRPVDRYPRLWTSIPSSGGFGSPYVGNGDIGVAFCQESSAFSLALGKNDFWVSEGSTYFEHLAAPTVTFNVTLPAAQQNHVVSAEDDAATEGWKGNVTQDLGNAKLLASLAGSNATVTAETIVTENNNNAVLTKVVCTMPGGVDCPVTITIADCCGNQKANKTGGSAGGSGVWIRKENLNDAVNAAQAGSCNPDELHYNVQRTFSVDPVTQAFTMQNGSCPWVLDAQDPTTSAITTGDCGSPQGKWTFRQGNNTSSHTYGTEARGGDSANITGQVVWSGATAFAKQSPMTDELCLSPGRYSVGLAPCNSTGDWLLVGGSGPNAGYLMAAPNMDQCLIVVPDNSNNTLASAVTVVESVSGAVVPAKSAPRPVNASVPSEGSEYSVVLKSGVEYTMITSVMTLRDIGCAGTRAHTEMCKTTIQEAAAAHAASFASASARAAAEKDHDDFWTAYWGASEVDLTQGLADAPANLTEVEKWYVVRQSCSRACVCPVLVNKEWEVG